MKRYIVISKFLIKSGGICEAEHGVTYNTMKAAAQGQLEHMNVSEYLHVGFRIVELEEVNHDV